MRIVVTRAAAQAQPLAARLEALGHDVVLCPLLEVEPLGMVRVGRGLITPTRQSRMMPASRAPEGARLLALGWLV